MPRKPPRPTGDEVMRALAAKSKIESRLGGLPAGKIEEDGSFRARDGRFYDNEDGYYRRRYSPPRRRRYPYDAWGRKTSHA